MIGTVPLNQILNNKKKIPDLKMLIILGLGVFRKHRTGSLSSFVLIYQVFLNFGPLPP